MKSTIMHGFTGLNSSLMGFTPTQIRFTVNTTSINPRDQKRTSIRGLQLGFKEQQQAQVHPGMTVSWRC